MPVPHRFTRFSNLTAACLFAIVALVGSGCGKDKTTNPNPGPGATSTSFEGTISGNGVSGDLSLKIATANPAPQGPARSQATVTASGTLVTGGSSVGLTGNYDTVNHAIAVAGGGWTLGGGLTSFGLEGTFTGPGSTSGVFSTQRIGSGTDTVVVVIGTFTSTTGGPGGVFNFSIRGAAIHGNAFPNGGTTAIPLDGTYTASSGAISIVNAANPTGPALATGTLQANGAASGTYDNQNGDSGTWTGARQ